MPQISPPRCKGNDSEDHSDGERYPAAARERHSAQQHQRERSLYIDICVLADKVSERKHEHHHNQQTEKEGENCLGLPRVYYELTRPFPYRVLSSRVVHAFPCDGIWCCRARATNRC